MVSISHLQRAFDREYNERWTYEYFIVSFRGMKQGLSYYTLKDVEGEKVDGIFYQPELSEVNITDETKFRVENVLIRRKDQVLVK